MTVPAGLESKLIVVTGGDAKYFALLKEQLASIRRLPQGKDLPLAVLDGGLEADQVAALEGAGARVVRPEWPSPELGRRYGGREYLRINLNKANLDRLFPEYQVILWLDGDTWLQTWDAVPLFCAVAAKGKLAVVSQASRLQLSHMALRRRWFGWVEPRGILFKGARRARLPADVAWALVDRPVLNTGAFALPIGPPGGPGSGAAPPTAAPLPRTSWPWPSPSTSMACPMRPCRRPAITWGRGAWTAPAGCWSTTTRPMIRSASSIWWAWTPCAWTRRSPSPGSTWTTKPSTCRCAMRRFKPPSAWARPPAQGARIRESPASRPWTRITGSPALVSNGRPPH
ncbi:MAG: hypothetical protein E2O90_12565 [Alphaproteobacteria bacterium]|nr:MAG: hypothetical protein E2O90_12565 [Alphaproteobacteria bacterium]